MTPQIDPEGAESKHLLRFAGLQLAGQKHVLEIGCGDGRLTWGYADRARAVTGIDLHADDLRVALIDRPAALIDKVTLARADALRLPFPGRSFDLAVFSWSF